MITIKSNSELNAIRSIYINLFNYKVQPSDNELFKEDTLSLELISELISERIYIKDNKLDTDFEYDKYFENGYRIAKSECSYWTKELFESGKVEELVSYLKDNPDSKRAILLLWKGEQRDLTQSAACMSYAFFRKDYDALNINVHMRANNAYSCILIDIDTMRALQEYIATLLNLKVGKYSHFVDSLHFYNKDLNSIKKYYEVWRNATD